MSVENKTKTPQQHFSGLVEGIHVFLLPSTVYVTTRMSSLSTERGKHLIARMVWRNAAMVWQYPCLVARPAYHAAPMTSQTQSSPNPRRRASLQQSHVLVHNCVIVSAASEPYALASNMRTMYSYTTTYSRRVNSHSFVSHQWKRSDCNCVTRSSDRIRGCGEGPRAAAQARHY